MKIRSVTFIAAGPLRKGVRTAAMALSTSIAWCGLAHANPWPMPQGAQSSSGVTQILQRQAGVEADLQCPSAAPVGALRLSEAVLRALCADPKTRISWAGVRAQQAEVLLRRAARWPTATATIDSGRVTTRDRFSDGSVERASGTAADLGVQVQWVLWDFGLRAAQESAAEHALVAAAASYDQTLQDSLLRVVEVFLNVVEAQASVRLNREAERFTRELLAESKRPGKGGESTLDLLGEKQARTALWSTVLDVRRAEANLSRSRGELALLMGQPAQSLYTVELRQPGAGEDTDASLMQMVNSALEAYPALREARARLTSAEAELDEARRSNAPVVIAQAGQQRLRTPLITGQTNRNLGVRIEIPLGSWEDRRQRMQRAQAQVDAARQSERQTRQDLELNIWLSYQNLRESTAALSIAERFRLSAEDLLAAELKAFREGDSDMFDVLDANSSRAQAALEEISSLTALNLARARLAAAMGQLTRLQLPASLQN